MDPRLVDLKQLAYELEGAITDLHHGKPVDFTIIGTLEHVWNTLNGLTMGLPKEPPPGLLMSMAIRQDHGLGDPGYYDNFPGVPGLSHQQRLDAAIRSMRQLYEEVSGEGFYRPEKEEDYQLWQKVTKDL